MAIPDVIAGILIAGLLMMATALRGTQSELAQQLQNDLLGKDGFVVWALAIVGIGLIGYIPGLRLTSRYLLALVGVVILLANQGLFQQAEGALQVASQQGPAPPINPPQTGPSPSASTTTTTSSGSGSSGASAAGGVLSGIGSLIGSIF